METPLYRSPLGTPVYSDLNITGDQYTDDSGTYTFTDIKIPEAILSVERKKYVVVTEINGCARPVVEYIGNSSYMIRINLQLTSADFSYPHDTVENLIRCLNSNRILKVNSWYLNQFGITDVLVMDYDMPQNEGGLFIQDVRISMISVSALELQQGIINNIPVF